MNDPLVTVSGYDLYPMFFILLGTGFILLFFLVLMIRRARRPESAAEPDGGLGPIADPSETAPARTRRRSAPSPAERRVRANPNNQVTAWQRETLLPLLDRVKAGLPVESPAEGVRLEAARQAAACDRLQSEIQALRVWDAHGLNARFAQADPAAGSPTLDLTSLLLEHLEESVVAGLTNEVVLAAYLVDAINGGFDQPASAWNSWMDRNIEPYEAEDGQGSKADRDDQRVLGLLLHHIDLHTDNLTEEAMDRAPAYLWNIGGDEIEAVISHVRREGTPYRMPEAIRDTALKIMIYQSRLSLHRLMSATEITCLRPIDLSQFRAMAALAEQAPYTAIVQSLETR